MPILFSGADEHTGIIYWAIVDGITVGENGTVCLYRDLREITPGRERSEVRLRDGDRPMVR